MTLEIPPLLKDEPEDLVKTVRDALCIQISSSAGCTDIKCAECMLGSTALRDQPEYFKAVIAAISKQIMEAPE